MTGPSTFLDEAGRAWDAAYQLNELRGDRVASEWCARKVRALWRSGQATDPAKVAAVADVLEARLARAREKGAA